MGLAAYIGTIGLLAALSAWPGVAAGQAPAAQPEASRADQPAGAAARASLVQRESDGSLRRLSVTPEEAALELMDLDDATRARTRAVLGEHTRMLDRLVESNFNVLVRWNEVREAPLEERSGVLRAFMNRLAPLRARGGLRAELSREMARDKAVRYEALVQEYWDAAVEETVRSERGAPGDSPGAGGADDPLRRDAAETEALRAIGQEVRRSFVRLMGARQGEFVSAAERVGVRPDQRKAIGKIFDELDVRGAGQATAEQRGEAAVRALDALKPAQQTNVLRELLASPKGK